MQKCWDWSQQELCADLQLSTKTSAAAKQIRERCTVHCNNILTCSEKDFFESISDEIFVESCTVTARTAQYRNIRHCSCFWWIDLIIEFADWIHECDVLIFEIMLQYFFESIRSWLDMIQFFTCNMCSRTQMLWNKKRKKNYDSVTTIWVMI